MVGIRARESWLFRLLVIGTDAMWGLSPNQKLPHWLLWLIWVCSRKESWLLPLSVSFLHLS